MIVLEEAGLGGLPINDGMKALALRHELEMEHRRSDAVAQLGVFNAVVSGKSLAECLPHLFPVDEATIEEREAHQELIAQKQQLAMLMKWGGQNDG